MSAKIHPFPKPGRDPEDELKKLNQRFAKVSREANLAPQFSFRRKFSWLMRPGAAVAGTAMLIFGFLVGRLMR